MQFVQSFLLLSSSLMLFYIALYSFMRKKTQGAFELFVLATATFIWTMGSLFEIISSTFEWKLFWRNIQQIGGFAVPILTVYFSIAYTMNVKLKKYINIVAIVPFVSVILIFTNEYHHIMRTGYTMLLNKTFGEILVVHSTVVGSTLVAFNLILPIISLTLLFGFSRKVSSNLRKQVYIIIFTFILTSLVTGINLAFSEDSGIFIPIPIYYIPSDIIMFYSIYKYRFFGLSPIARDKVFEVVNQGIFVVNKDNVIIDANSYAEELTRKYSDFQDPLIGANVEDVYSTIEMTNESISLRKEIRHEIKVDYNGEKVYLCFNNYPLCSNGNNHIGSVLIINDITPQKLHEIELKERADKDFLTELLNRNGFYSKFDHMIKKAEYEDRTFSVFMMDLDNFKIINDTYGHANGDRILCHFSNLIKNALRPNDIVGRIGGEEFAVILPQVKKEDAFKIAETLREKVAYSKVLLTEEKEIAYTVSIGITDNDEPEKNLSAILEEADTALYQAKKQSRNCSVVFSNEVSYIN